MRKFIMALVIMVLLAVMAVGGYQIYRGLHTYRVIDDYYEDVDQMYVIQPSAPEKTEEPEQSEVLEALTETELPAVAEETDTEVTVYAPISIDFDVLLQDCPDTVGWLYSLDEEINLPVVQGSDNQYYLTHLPNGKESSGGSLFLDYLNQRDFSGDISFIYGHNMKNGTMLQPILRYQEQTYYDQYPMLYLLTPEQNYQLELFAGFVTTMESDAYTFSFDTAEKKAEFIENMVAQSDFTPTSIPEPKDRLLCLSTCAYDFENARYVVLGKLTECG